MRKEHVMICHDVGTSFYPTIVQPGSAGIYMYNLIEPAETIVETTGEKL